MKILARCLMLVALITMAKGELEATDFHVYFLGGQSNMDGYGNNSDLPESLLETQGRVPIFHGNTSPDNTVIDGKGCWKKLQPGHGVGFKSDGQDNQYSDRFGVELSFARSIQEQYPDRRIAIIKYSRGGTSIDAKAAGGFGCWEPYFKGRDGVNQYDHFLATLRNAFEDSDIDDDGEPDRLIPAGIVWMQGESDGTMYSASLQYEANLKRLMDPIRASLHQDDLPVVVGRISDSMKDGKKVWEFGETLRAAQAAFCDKDSAASLVTSTDNYGYSDPWHYDTAGYLDLGEKFAEAMNELRKK